MASPQSHSVVIICPHCATRYQVPSDTLGPKGRQVSCAHCGKSWNAVASDLPPAAPKPAEKPRLVEKPDDDDTLFDAKAEAELDEAFAAEQKAVAAAAAPPRPPLPAPAEQLRSIEEIKAAIAPKPSAAPPARPNPVQTRQQQRAFALRQNSLTKQLPLARVRRTARTVGL